MLAKLELADREELARWTGQPSEATRRSLLGLGAVFAPLGWARRLLSNAATPAQFAAVGSGTVALAIAMSVALGSAARDGGEHAASTQTAQSGTEANRTHATPTSTATPDALELASSGRSAVRTWPTGTRIGIEPIDRVVAAVESRDAQAVLAAIAWRGMACAPNSAELDAACEGVLTERSTVDAVGEPTCEGTYVQRGDEAASLVRNLMDEWPALYAVYRQPAEPPTARTAAPSLVIVFSRTASAGPEAVRIAVGESGIAAINVECGRPLEDAIPTGAEFVLAPRGYSTDDTGNPAVDALIETVESHDVSALAELIRISPSRCQSEAGPGSTHESAQCTEPGATGVQTAFDSWDCAPRRDDVDSVSRLLEEAIAIGPSRYAAFVPPDDYRLADARVVLLFEGPDPRVEQPGFMRGLAVGTDGSQVTGIWLACGAGSGAASLLPSAEPDYLLAPRMAATRTSRPELE